MAKWDHKYYYNNANAVWNQYEAVQPCFAYMSRGGKEEYFFLRSVLNKEQSVMWLEILKKEVDFKYEHIEKNKYKIYWPRTDWKFVVMFGNLCKGLTEFAFFCERHLADTTDDPFFVKSLRAFQSLAAEDLLELNYTSNHGWWDYEDRTKVPALKATTLKELFNRIPKHKGRYDVWPFCLKGKNE